jgi:thymidylate synthase (FAD)
MTEPTKLARAGSTELDDILGDTFPVLDDGFVRAVDYMGTDATIVRAARVSYGAGTERVRKNRGLIRYLMRHGHTTPFEMCELMLHVRVPMDTWRQWIRHRTANVNEYSTRYSVAIDAAATTKPDEWRLQNPSNRQGSSGHLDAGEGERLSQAESRLHSAAKATYEERLHAGVAREQARKDLPLSTYTEAYWKTDLHNLFHFLRLRMDSHAQLEIRQYAQTIGEQIVRRWVPVAWEAFSDYRLEGLSLSGFEAEIAAAISGGDPERAFRLAEEHGLSPSRDAQPSRNRERSELEEKLIRLSLSIPWSH